MTLSSPTAEASYVGNGTTQIFTVPFYFLVDTDLLVSKKTAATGAVTVLTLNSDYTLTGAGNPAGGSATLVVAPAAGDQILIERDVEAVQETAYPTNGIFPADSHEKALDRLTMLVQQLQTQDSRTLTRGGLDTTYDVTPYGLTGLPTAVNATDAVSYNQVQTMITAAGTGTLPGNIATYPTLALATGASLIGFQEASGNSVATTVQNKLRNLDLDWKDFGIVADGVTDDSAALEKAINAANGRRLILPYGTAASPAVIKITRPLVLTSGIAPHLIGFGADKTIIRLAAASLAVDAIGFVGAPRGMKIMGIRFDQNSVATSTTCGMLALQNAEDLEVAYCEFVGWDKYGLGLNGPRYFDIHHNRITRTAAAGTYNQAFLISSSSRASLNGRFSYNTCLRSGIDVDGSNIEISNNDISAFQFGAGVTTEQSVNSNRYTIRDNVIYSSSGIDSNSYRCGGIENWGPYSVISGNKIFGNSGSGIDQGGGYCYVAGNVCYNNGVSGTPGSVAGGDGIVSRYGTSTYNANYSTYIGNTCFDSQGSKTQGYGYSDQSSSLTGITLRGNKYGAHLTGSENILAGIVDRDAPVLEASYTTDPPSLTSGARASYAQTFAGARLGDLVECSFSNNLQDIELWGYVQATNTIVYVFDNNAAGTIDLASGTVRVRVKKPSGYAPLF